MKNQALSWRKVLIPLKWASRNLQNTSLISLTRQGIPQEAVEKKILSLWWATDQHNRRIQHKNKKPRTMESRKGDRISTMRNASISWCQRYLKFLWLFSIVENYAGWRAHISRERKGQNFRYRLVELACHQKIIELKKCFSEFDCTSLSTF